MNSIHSYFVEIEGFDCILDEYIVEGYYVKAEDREGARDEALKMFTEEHEDCQDVEFGIYYQNAYGIE